MEQDLLNILPQLIVLATSMLALCFEMLRRATGSLWVLVIGLAAAAGVAISKLGTVTTAFSETFRVDFLSLWAAIILGGAGILSALLMRQELRKTGREGTLSSLVGFSTLGSMILAGAGDMMFLVLGVLISGLTGFGLAAYPKTDKATEGGIKYFIYGSVTGAVMLFMLTFWAGTSGSTLLSALGQPGLEPVLVLLGFAGVLAGLGYSASLFPFHFWTPDVFEGAPVSVAAFVSVTPKIGAFFALAQVMRSLHPEGLDYNLILALLAAFSMTFGNVVALWQKNVLRLMAYSTIAQAGYFLLGVIAINGSELAVSSLVVFSVAYAAMNIGAFAIIQQVGPQILNFEGLARKKPFMAVAMVVFLLSLVGLPPLAGFAGKFLLFGAAIDVGYSWLAIIAILNSVISLAVYLRIINPMFFKKQPVFSSEPSTLLRWVFLSSFAVTVLVGIAVRYFL
ncbi:NADH-quinone oxidoreductase subunit N [Gillisia sp. Hel_I_86]|uniref:NADH-quinone oxidoreductase subunit N n=1 Tax=Gillisia sp. Hel_I_86 TaxID=1249981 RepID=UPI00119ABE4C|nr:NADH-quinone oxidoreductase subunit N [Gillisia sp. Hel_I_86]TVZ28635.1 NADH-quinone oxidoreductase subunit N [Gillisia sp. Hel_I_86]